MYINMLMKLYKVVLVCLLIIISLIFGYLLTNPETRHNTCDSLKRFENLDDVLPIRKDRFSGIYLSSFSEEDKSFAEKQVFPRINSRQELIDTYLESLKCNNKKIAKILSVPEFPNSESVSNFNTKFESIWSQISNKQYTIIRICSDASNCIRYFFIDVGGQRYRLSFHLDSISFEPDKFFFGKIGQDFTKCTNNDESCTSL